MNNAAIVNRFDFSTTTDLSDMLEKEININFIAPFELIKLFLPLLKKQSNAKIVNATSGLAISPRANQPIYCATKSALQSFTKSLRFQLKDEKGTMRELFNQVIVKKCHLLEKE